MKLTPDSIEEIAALESIGQRSIRMEDAVLVQRRVVNDVHGAVVDITVYKVVRLPRTELVWRVIGA